MRRRDLNPSLFILYKRFSRFSPLNTRKPHRFFKNWDLSPVFWNTASTLLVRPNLPCRLFKFLLKHMQDFPSFAIHRLGHSQHMENTPVFFIIMRFLVREMKPRGTPSPPRVQAHSRSFFNVNCLDDRNCSNCGNEESCRSCHPRKSPEIIKTPAPPSTKGYK